MSGDLHSPELGAIEVDGITRSSFLLRGALAAGAMYGAGAVGPYVSRALAQSASGDIAILNFALVLEQLEAAFLKFALKNAKLSGPVKQLATLFAEQEAEHAATLKQTVTMLGGKPAPAPKVKFNAVSDEKSFLAVGIKLEEAGIGAYNGAAPRLQSPDLLAAAGGIVQVEARHAAALRMHAGQDPAPAAFDTPLRPAQVQAAVKRALKG
jgi:rubrerythrin